MFGLSQVELLMVGAVALLLFGNRLPSVARSFGKSLSEFKKGISGVQNEFDEAMRESDRAAREQQHNQTPSAPKFIPPTAPPQTVTE